MKNPKKLHVSFQSMFFLCGLHNLGKIRPNHWTLRGSDMPRMLCPARCRKVWIRCLNTFENNKCPMIFMVDDLGLKPFYTFYEVSSGVLCVCASVSLKTVTYRHVVQPDCWHPFREWMFLPSKQTAADQQTTKDSSELFFWSVIYIYIYVCVCVLMMISLVPHFLMMLFHVFHHMFSWFPIVFPYLPDILSHVFSIFFFEKNLFEQIFFEKKQFPHIFPRFFHGFPRSHGTWRQHWQRRRHATAQLHGQPRGQPRQPRGQRSPVRWPRSYGVPWGRILGSAGVCWMLIDLLNHG